MYLGRPASVNTPTSMSEITSRSGMHLASGYMLSSFTSLLDSTTHGTAYCRPAKPDCLSAKFVAESDTIIPQLVRAFLNPGQCSLADSGYIAHARFQVATSWDFDDYTQACHKHNIFSGLQQKERSLLKKFPWITKEEIRSITTPRTITDCNGKILMWVLPGVLSPHVQVCVFRCQVSVIEHVIANHL